ncbi:MAG: hypothetical protein ACEPOW_11940 [Bacteroidales bacterium]
MKRIFINFLLICTVGILLFSCSKGGGEHENKDPVLKNFVGLWTVFKQQTTIKKSSEIETIPNGYVNISITKENSFSFVVLGQQKEINESFDGSWRELNDNTIKLIFKNQEGEDIFAELLRDKDRLILKDFIIGDNGERISFYLKKHE